MANVNNYNVNKPKNDNAVIVSGASDGSQTTMPVQDVVTPGAVIGASAVPKPAALTPEERASYDSLYAKDSGTNLREDRPYYTDDADATYLSGADYELTTRNKNEWHRLEKLKKQAKDAGDMNLVAQLQAQQDALHAENERIRAGYGYSGGANGSMYYVFPDDTPDGETGRVGGTFGDSQVSRVGTSPNLDGLLEAWQQAALQQSNAQIDYAVQQSVTQLEQAPEDSDAQFKEQSESIARDEMQALDNSALYSELRGDKGGIGQEQYNSIRNTAAQNRLAVQQAQTKLATDTARQIADLRAQGEFEKADAALELAQTYLSELVKLEQWSAEFDLSAAEFEASLAQWQAEYNMDLQKMQLGHSQWQQEFNASQTKMLASMGEALLGAGVMPTAAQLSAMGMTSEQADSYLILRQLESAR